MHRHLEARRAELPGLVAELPAPSAVRPDAGNLRVLVHRAAPPQLTAAIEQIADRAVPAGARHRPDCSSGAGR